MPTRTTPAQIPAEAQTCHHGVSLHAHVLTKRATTNDAKQMPSSARVIRRCRYHGRRVTPDVTLGILREDASRSKGMLRVRVFLKTLRQPRHRWPAIIPDRARSACCRTRESSPEHE